MNVSLFFFSQPSLLKWTDVCSFRNTAFLPNLRCATKRCLLSNVFQFPNLVASNLVICNVFGETLFCALLRSFADLFFLRSFALIRALLSLSACDRIYNDRVGNFRAVPTAKSECFFSLPILGLLKCVSLTTL